MIDSSCLLIFVSYRDITSVFCFYHIFLIWRIYYAIRSEEVVNMQEECNCRIFRINQTCLPIKLDWNIRLIITLEIIALVST